MSSGCMARSLDRTSRTINLIWKVAAPSRYYKGLALDLEDREIIALVPIRPDRAASVRVLLVSLLRAGPQPCSAAPSSCPARTPRASKRIHGSGSWQPPP